MFSNGDYYDLDSASAKLQQMKMMLDIKIQLNALEDVLVKRGVIGASDVNACVEYLKTTNAYKTMFDYIQVQEAGIKNYKNNPQQHLKDLFNAKLNGTIK